ncbi:MAG: hypothetical protein PHY93_16335 [Bacteriovorax sp.]|nr:hypothetical protein [Bacteriovorax sp.]
MATETVSKTNQTSAFQNFLKLINTSKHELSLRLYMLVVLAHWGEHLVQAFQIFVLKWPRPASRGILGQWFPWLVSSEVLHYGYALFMLIGLWFLRSGFKGRSLRWWNIALVIQFWHHIEHLLLQCQVIFHTNLFNSPVPISILQLFVPRVELHMFYNTMVFIPMVIGMYYHLFPTKDERAHHLCSCAV